MGKLGKLSFNKSNPVVQLIDSSKDLYTLRVRGKHLHAARSQRPKLYD